LVACSRAPERPSPNGEAPRDAVARAAPLQGDAGAESPGAEAPAAAPTPEGASDAGEPVTPLFALTAAQDPYGWVLTAAGLPAVSADGRRAALIVDVSDGMRGYPGKDLVVVAVDTDKPAKRMRLLVPSEFAPPTPSAPAPDRDALAKKIRARLAAAEKELAKTAWVSLAHIEAIWQPDVMRYKWGSVAGLEVSLDGGRLHARDAKGRALLDRDVSAWTAASYTIPGFTPCTFDAQLKALAADVTRRALVVVVTQVVVQGGDSCDGLDAAHALRLSAPLAPVSPPADGQ
jgi:hypothetical protein